MATHRIGVVGGGRMGTAIALLAVQHGFDVVLHARRSAARDRFVATACRRAHAARTMVTAEATDDLGDLRGAAFVVEAVTESLGTKCDVLAAIADHCGDEPVIGTTTSSLAIGDLARASGVARLVGIHFFNPVPVVPVVEVVTTSQTPAELGARAAWLVARLGRRPIAVEDAPGFVVNRCLVPAFLEACRLLDEGWTARRIDAEYRAIGMIAGPLRIADMVGLDVVHAVCRHCSVAFGPRFTPPPRLAVMIAAGFTGRKTGRGFHDYTGAPAEPDGTAPAKVAPERLIVPLVNEALRCRAAGIASAADVDAAVTGVLGLPVGPLASVSGLGADAYAERVALLVSLHGRRFALEASALTPYAAGRPSPEMEA
jgi:3-hydroxybutyryl-CoA dehydrogenase